MDADVYSRGQDKAIEGEGVRASERAYLALREDIVEGRLPPGSVLAEVEQAQRLGLSRTPLREALGRLGAEGLAAPQGGRGVVVTEISLAHAAELFELRVALECKASALAARRGEKETFSGLHRDFLSASTLLTGRDPSRHAYYELTARLDRAIDSAVDNGYFLQALNGLRLHLVRIRRLGRDDPPRLLAAATEHANIAGAIAAGDSCLAASATAVHLNNSLEHLKSTHRQKESEVS